MNSDNPFDRIVAAQARVVDGSRAARVPVFTCGPGRTIERDGRVHRFGPDHGDIVACDKIARHIAAALNDGRLEFDDKPKNYERD